MMPLGTLLPHHWWATRGNFPLTSPPPCPCAQAQGGGGRPRRAKDAAGARGAERRGENPVPISFPPPTLPPCPSLQVLPWIERKTSDITRGKPASAKVWKSGVD